MNKTVIEKNIMPHALRMKRLFASNEQIIIKHLGITESHYRQYIFDSGMAFLEMYYDVNRPEQYRWIQRFSRDKKLGFWNWWTGEWKVRENLFLKAHRRGFTYDDWVTFNYLHTVSEEMQVSFYNWIKHKNHKL